MRAQWKPTGSLAARLRRAGAMSLIALAALVVAPAASASFPAERASAECGAPCRIHMFFHGTGSGRVVATWQEDEPKSFTCLSWVWDCTVSTDYGVTITFRAFADPGSQFETMIDSTECPVGTDPVCTFFMDFERQMDITFGGEGLPPPPGQPPPPPPPPPILLPPPPPPPPPGEEIPAGCTIVGTSGNDDLDATGADDVICGLGGNDHIHVGGGRDVVRAGDGNDTVEVGAGVGHLVFGGSGRDTVLGGYAPDRIHGGPGDDLLRGGAGVDVIQGDDGNDRIVGGSGADRLYGGSGRDTIRSKDGVVDTVVGGAGSDLAFIDESDHRHMRLVEHHRHR